MNTSTSNVPGNTASPAAALVVGLASGKLAIAVPAAADAAVYPLELRAEGRLATVVNAADAARLPVMGYNLLLNPDFALGKQHWELVNPDKGGVFGLDVASAWIISGGHTAYIKQEPTDAPEQSYAVRYVDAPERPRVPILPGARYLVSGYFGMHRCNARIEVDLFDGSGTCVGREAVALTSGKWGGVSFADYEYAEHAFVAPKSATSAELRLVKLGRMSGEDSFLFFTRVQLTFAPEGAELIDVLTLTPALARQLRERIDGGMNLVAVGLPYRQFGNATLKLEVLCGPAQEQALGSPLLVDAQALLGGSITSISGTMLNGRVSARISGAPDSRLWVYVDDKLCGQTHPGTDGSDDMLNFNFALPADLFDGRTHVIAVQSSDGQTVCEHAAVLPFALTPWAALEKYAGRPLPAPLSPIAAHRYESLSRSLELISERRALPGADAAALLAEAASLHPLHALMVGGYSARASDLVIEFPKVAKPRVSVVVPVHNKWNVTRHCLAALRVAANRAAFEVIVVDDGSSDDTLLIGERVKNITLVRHDKAQGFVVACNRGAEKARGEFVVLLNNDTEPAAGWLDEMLYVFDHFDGIGLAGSKLLYPDGRLQEAGGIVWGNGEPWNYGRDGNPHDPRYSYLRQVDYVSGASIMLPRALWQKLGGFSTEFIPAYYEDTDLAFKVRAAGFKVVYVPHSVVYHFEGMSSGTSTASGMKKFQDVNRPKFRRKWAAAFSRNGEYGKDVDLAKDRGISNRALVIDVGVPRLDNDAGSYAAIQEMRLLQSLGFKITFVSENLAYLGRDSERLMRMGIETVFAPYAQSVAEMLEKRGSEFDIVYTTRYYSAQVHLANCRRWAPQAKILFCNADLHFLRMMREAMIGREAPALAAAQAVREQELAVCREVDAVLSYSYVEHAVLEGHGIPRSKIATCPWVVEVPEKVPGFAARKDIAYLGGFGHGPNKQAMMYFVEQVLPLLRARLPEVNLRIYGSGSEEALAQVKRDGVIVEGWVRDVADVYDSCRVFLAPLMTGAGLKGKVVGALARGTPSVLSPIAAEGTHVRDGEEAFIADDPARWVERIAALYTDAALWQAMSDKARTLAAAHFSFDEGRRLMALALETAGVYVDSTTSPALAVRLANPL